MKKKFRFSDSEVVLVFIPEAYHLRREETDWFDKPRDGRSENGQEKRQVKQGKKTYTHILWMQTLSYNSHIYCKPSPSTNEMHAPTLKYLDLYMLYVSSY